MFGYCARHNNRSFYVNYRVMPKLFHGLEFNLVENYISDFVIDLTIPLSVTVELKQVTASCISLMALFCF